MYLVLVLNGSLAQVLYRLSREFSKFSKLYGQMRQALSLIENHDQEFDEVVWMSIQNAKEKLTYKDEFSILEKAFHAKYKK